ncbi:PREDICTED: acyl-CoA-binding domain-containing protein 4 [Nanorana parkeri]|uniref:acyl-CoA-binding domain-containing protein 4 n=1 Tax=Nanorana parkeri TaxID=125878 RepID=UPI000854399B|nr:PREDICTED: acyl-CoA-binding domain-containing protein 4 [Nanorana parkeri]
MGTDQDESGYQRQFNAAVSVIQGLPKSGSYRPSYEEMLLFYSYYKQATVGPCNITRPGFWDPIGRYKWDAWNKLGQMSQEDAMGAYIREMKKVAQKIINTVPLEDKTPEMFEPFRPLYEVIPDMPRPPDSFFKTYTEEETFEVDKYQVLKEEKEEQYVSTPEQTDPGAHWGQGKEEERSDPVGPERMKDHDPATVSPSLGHACLKNPGESSSSDMSSGSQNTCRSSSHHLSPQIAATVESLQASVQGLSQQLEVLERILQDQQQYIRERIQRSSKEPNPQRSGIGQSQTLLFIVIWPFFVNWLLRRLYGRKS